MLGAEPPSRCGGSRSRQRAARAAITHILTLPSDPASAIVSIDPRTGAIRAMAAVTPGRTGNQFNFATSARRQPGSTFKTVALTTAVALGMNPMTTYYLSAPLHYQPDPLCNPRDPGCAWGIASGPQAAGSLPARCPPGPGGSWAWRGS